MGNLSLHSKEAISHVQVDLPVHPFLPITFCAIARAPPSRAWIHLLGTLPSDTHIDKVSSQSALREAEQAQLPPPSLIREVLNPLIIFSLSTEPTGLSKGFKCGMLSQYLSIFLPQTRQM